MIDISELKNAGALAEGAYADAKKRGLYQLAGAIHAGLLALNAAIQAMEPAPPTPPAEEVTGAP